MLIKDVKIGYIWAEEPTIYGHYFYNKITEINIFNSENNRELSGWFCSLCGWCCALINTF